MIIISLSPQFINSQPQTYFIVEGAGGLIFVERWGNFSAHKTQMRTGSGNGALWECSLQIKVVE